MTYDPIPNEVREFIIDKIDSVAELEGLLLLSRNPEIDWSAEGLAQRLYTSIEQTGEILNRLYTLGFLSINNERPLTYNFRPHSPKLAETVNRVSEIYSKYLVPVTNLIHSKPETKVQKFADAFDFRKKEDK